MKISNVLADKARQLRQQLHSVPERALEEHRTKEILMSFIRSNTSLALVDRGSWFYACHEVEGCEDAVAFRADYDAVEGSDGQCGHFCGHDGHAATLAAFAVHVSETRPSRSVYLIFQPAEETGQGALLCRELLMEKPVKEIYAFHNIPGYPENSVIILEKTFACASTGLEITLTGSPAHAAYPDAGKNPAETIAKLILLKEQVLQKYRKGLVLSTVIGADIGSSAYGMSASRGVLRLTLRAEHNDDFESLVSEYTSAAQSLADDAGLLCEIRRIEEFTATVNTARETDRVRTAARNLGLKAVYPGEPFRWSEDFGWYLKLTKGAYFGIGDGESYPELHTAGYSFPDDIIPAALGVFSELI